MQRLADISQFESLMNGALFSSHNSVFNADVHEIQFVSNSSIDQFVALMNDRKGMDKYGHPKKDPGYYDGVKLEWHAYDALPEIEPDDGWNAFRRESPTYFLECGMKTPDDGWNSSRMTEQGRYLLAMNEFKKSVTGRLKSVMDGEDEDKIYPLVKTLMEDWKGGEKLKEDGYKFKFDVDKYIKYADQWWSNWVDRRYAEADKIDAEATQDMNDSDTVEYYLKRQDDPSLKELLGDLQYGYYYKKKAQDLFETLDRNQRGEARKNSLVSTYFGHPYSEFLRWAQHALDGGFVDKSFASYGLPPTTWNVEDCLEQARDSFLEMSDEEQIHACINNTELVKGFYTLMEDYKKKREAERDTDADKEVFRDAVLKHGGPYKEFEVWGGRYERGSGYVEDSNRKYRDKESCGVVAEALLRMMDESDYAKLRSDPLFLRIGQELAPDVWERVMGSDAGTDAEVPVIYDDTDEE